MKRSTLAAVAIVALALPAVALTAITGKYEGHTEDFGDVSFKVVKDGGEKFVKKFKWDGLTIECDQGNTFYSGEFTFRDRIRNREFKFRGVNDEDPPGEVVAKGELTGGGNAEGTIKATGTIETQLGTRTGCHTGKVAWEASKN